MLPDSAIIQAASVNPQDEQALLQLPVYKGRAQRRLAGTWMRALRTAAAMPKAELPDPAPPTDGPPPANRWADKDPEAAARLAAARTALNKTAEENRLPVENLLQPDLLRRTCWTPPEDKSVDGVTEALRAGGARNWQLALVAESVSKALHATAH